MALIYFQIVNPTVKAQEQVVSDMDIMWYCPDWQKNGCSIVSAENIKIKDTDDGYLSDLCAERYGTAWSKDVYEQCKELCKGCTSE
ncbi:MAG: hypothetical protein V1818_03765 [Candidatus Aenigmatarchaeota archaeon]